jgi:hypothetical protein
MPAVLLMYRRRMLPAGTPYVCLTARIESHAVTRVRAESGPSPGRVRAESGRCRSIHRDRQRGWSQHDSSDYSFCCWCRQASREEPRGRSGSTWGAPREETSDIWLPRLADRSSPTSRIAASTAPPTRERREACCASTKGSRGFARWTLVAVRSSDIPSTALHPARCTPRSEPASTGSTSMPAPKGREHPHLHTSPSLPIPHRITPG